MSTTKKPNISYFPDIITFDTETTSYVTYKKVTHRDKSVTTEVDKKYAWAYVMDFDRIVCGMHCHTSFREWEDVVHYLDTLSSICPKNKRYIIWVHNLSFEFQFMKDWMKLTEVFARKSHNVIRCVYKNIEFRDTLALSNCKLEKLAKNENLPVKKKVGDLDYNLIRTRKTPITETEWGYIYSDTEIVAEYIKKKVKEYGTIGNIPMTSTGEVRYLFIDELLTTNSLQKIHNLAKKYTASTMELQNLLISIYAGAYTHCNYMWIDQTLHNLRCRDIASSYPYQMVARKYPTIWFKLRDGFTFEELVEKYPPEDFAWAFHMRVRKVMAKHCHNILSLHKAKRISSDKIIDNGRIVACDYLEFDMNETDLQNFLDFYDFDETSLEIWDVHISKKEYLPKELVSVILKLFQQKTSLKGITGQEDNYMRSKNRINGVYGSSVFNILNSGTFFDEISNMKFIKEEKSWADFNKYTNNPKQYLWYSIGVWVTSYARRQILMPIKHMSENAVYCDTDSVKYLGKGRYDKYWKVVNNLIKEKYLAAMKYHGFTEDEYRFFTTKYTDENGIVHESKEKFMGIFEEEEPYRHFKSLGSKRYLAEYFDYDKGDYVVKSTVAGAPKNLADYLGDTAAQKFKNFKHAFSLPNCKLCHTYTEGRSFMCITDYTGQCDVQEVRSGVCLTPADFSMNMDKDFFNFLAGRITFEDKDIYNYFIGNQRFTH